MIRIENQFSRFLDVQSEEFHKTVGIDGTVFFILLGGKNNFVILLLHLKCCFP